MAVLVAPSPSSVPNSLLGRRWAWVPSVVCLVSITGTVPYDLSIAALTPLNAAGRLVMLASLLTWFLAGRLAPQRLIRAIRFPAMLLAGAGYLTLLSTEGGSHGIYFSMVLAIPFSVVMFMPGDFALVVAVNAEIALGAVLIMLRDGRSGVEVLAFVGLALGGALLNGCSAILLQRAWDAKLASERERIRALETLAIAQRREADAERLLIIGQLAAGVVHEINNPLSFLGANLEWLVEERRAGALGGHAELEAVLSDSQAGVAQIRSIVDDLRAFSRGDEAVSATTEILPAVEEALRIAKFRLKGRVDLRRALPDGLPVVRIQRRHLVQVLLNLLVNAADALESHDAGPRWIEIAATASQAGVSVSVEDSGPGIPREVQARLFQRFFTTKAAGKGTGLGLAISREYVERAGGSLVLESLPGRGAKFVIGLRAAPPLVQGKQVEAASAAADC